VPKRLEARFHMAAVTPKAVSCAHWMWFAVLRTAPSSGTFYQNRHIRSFTPLFTARYDTFLGHSRDRQTLPVHMSFTMRLLRRISRRVHFAPIRTVVPERQLAQIAKYRAISA
jgi:hypothetical protein